MFPFLSSQDLPSSHKVHEASRLVLDRSLLTKEARRPIVDKLIVAYMERGIQRNIDGYVGFMLPRIWTSTFLRAGWDVEWLGPETALCGSLRSPCACSLSSQVIGQPGLAQPGPGTCDVVRAAWMPVNERMEDKIRTATGLKKPVLNYGSESFAPSVVSYSHLRREDNLAA